MPPATAVIVRRQDTPFMVIYRVTFTISYIMFQCRLSSNVFCRDKTSIPTQDVLPQKYCTGSKSIILYSTKKTMYWIWWCWLHTCSYIHCYWSPSDEQYKQGFPVLKYAVCFTLLAEYDWAQSRNADTFSIIKPVKKKFNGIWSVEVINKFRKVMLPCLVHFAEQNSYLYYIKFWFFLFIIIWILYDLCLFSGPDTGHTFCFWLLIS